MLISERATVRCRLCGCVRAHRYFLCPVNSVPEDLIQFRIAAQEIGGLAAPSSGGRDERADCKSARRSSAAATARLGED